MRIGPQRILMLASFLFALSSCSSDDENKLPNSVTIDGTDLTVTNAVLSVDSEQSTSEVDNGPMYFHEIILYNGLTVSGNELKGTGNSVSLMVVSSESTLKPGTYSFNSNIAQAKAMDLTGAVLRLNYTMDTEKGDRYEDITVGDVTVDQSGDVFTIDFTGIINGKSVTAYFEGKLSTIDTQHFTSTCRVSKITSVYTYTNTSFTITSVYEYSSGGLLAKVSDEYLTITYTNENGLITTATQPDDVDHFAFTETYSYQNGLLSQVSGTGDIADFPPPVDYVHDFVYQDGKLSTKKTNQTKDGVPSYHRYAYHTYNGDNLAVLKVESSTANENGTSVCSGYDSKKNPYLLLAKAMGNQIFYFDGALVSKNNVSKVLRDDGYMITYSYEYNANGYPSKITKVDPDFGTTVDTFEYTNCN
jgi:hypothetical protein